MKPSRTAWDGRRRRDVSPVAGVGRSIAHHGEILQGVFAGPDGRRHHALVTLPCSIRGAEARFSPRSDAALTVRPEVKTKALRAAALTLSRLGVGGEVGGRLEVFGNVPEGWGMGSSTSDVVASVRAVCESLGKRLSAASIARLAAEAEVACDPLMFGERVVLFAHRRGEALEDLGERLPPMEVVGFNCRAGGGSVNTLDLPPIAYEAREEAFFATMLETLRAAVAGQDARLVGEVASQSARINQKHRPRPGFGPIPELVAACDAAGFNVAHSGSVASLLFDAKDREVLTKTVEAQRILSGLGMRPWKFRAP